MDYSFLCKMKFENVKYILTDIEGTTTSVKFVYDVLFPYFRSHIGELRDMVSQESVQTAFRQTVELAASLENKKLNSVDDIINTLYRWSEEDRKITPLKTVQGILWQNGYESGEIKGHVYEEVADALKSWKEKGFELGVFSSGSSAAQKLIFGFSEAGDLTPYFSHYFDTITGGKRELETYPKIAEAVNVSAESILFLSDIVEELEAAKAAGFQTVQLVRPGTTATWEKCVNDFTEIEL
jgi:enolase-phosphatase E1